MHCLCENLFLLNSLSFPSLGIRHGNRRSFISVKAISSSQLPPASSFSRSKFSVFAVAEASEVKAVAPVALDGLIMNLKVSHLSLLMLYAVFFSLLCECVVDEHTYIVRFGDIIHGSFCRQQICGLFLVKF